MNQPPWETIVLGNGAFMLTLEHAPANHTNVIIMQASDHIIIYDMCDGGRSAINCMEYILDFLLREGHWNAEHTIYESSNFGGLSEVCVDKENKALRFLEIG